jgi:1-acyl-sn-glycerol-3-phosphate acyltransferase
LACAASALAPPTLICAPLHDLDRVAHYGSPFPKLFLFGAARIIGARVRVHGVPLKAHAFDISNHLSWVRDILALGGASGTAFVAEAELSQAPIVRVAGADQPHRCSSAARTAWGVADQINRLKEALADNWSITAFPEGTCTDGKSLPPFKASHALARCSNRRHRA